MGETEYEAGEPDGTTPEPVGHSCDCHGGCGTPANITINVHGSVLPETKLADIVRKHVLRYRQGGNGLSSA
jgi:hypothetical protein